MRDALAAVPFGLFLEPFAQLEEQHNEHGFGELRFGSGHKADDQRTDGGDAHKEILAQGLAVKQSFGSLLQGVPTYHQIRDQIEQ